MTDEKSDWPLVHERDDGIRPAGPPDECFYCRRKIGQHHAPNCVVVTKRVLLRVVALDGALVGTWELDVPHDWTAETIEFSKNESTWCADNILGYRSDVAWNQPGAWERLEAEIQDGSCLCDKLEVKFVRVVDNTPRRDLVDKPAPN